MPLDTPIPYGRYELLEPIGLGGMAEVFRARLPGVEGFEKQVVVKRLQARFRDDERFKRMFVEEAKLASQVQHKNVVQVFELGHHHGELYMVLEYVPGTDLKRLFRQAFAARLSVPLWLSVHIAIEVLEALAYAHDLKDAQSQRRNLVHCDVTPENIFLSTGGEVKLADFGVAHDDTRREDDFPGEVRGKLAYMAPEQLSGRPVDQRADVFSAAVVLWESLAQRRLFRGPTDDDTVARICHEDRVPPSVFNRDVPPSLDAVILAALRADRTRRTRSAREMQRALIAVQTELNHRVALVDVERALRKILTATPPPGSAKDTSLDPSKIPTVESELPSEGIEWSTMPPRGSAALPQPTGTPKPALRRASSRRPSDSDAAPTPRVAIPRKPSSDLGSGILTPPRSPSVLTAMQEPTPPPASLSAGWTAALTGSEPPRLPPGHVPAVEPSPLFVAPIRGGTSQVETADILRRRPPWARAQTPRPAEARDESRPPSSTGSHGIDRAIRAPSSPSLRPSSSPQGESAPRTPSSPGRGEALPPFPGPGQVLDTPGMWLRRPGGPETGPRPVPDALTVLRRLLLDSPVLDAQVSVDGKTWQQGTVLARLLGEEVVPADGLLPMSQDRGPLDNTSLVAIFGRLFRRRQSGRLIIVLDRPGRPQRYELHVHRGRLFHVASSRSLFAAWRSLLCSPHVEQPQLRSWVIQVIRQTQPFELVAASPAVEAVRAQQAHFAQDDLQTLFAERTGRFAFAAHPSPPSPNGSGHALLTLIPSLVSRACRTPDLERRLLSRLSVPMEKSPEFDVEAGQLGLSHRDAAALDRFVDGAPISKALAEPSDPRMRKLTLVLAYTLSELGLLRPCITVTP